jgi:hypothetical protein
MIGMDADYADDMTNHATVVDFSRGVSVSMRTPRGSGPVNDAGNALARMKASALLLWREAGSPPKFVTHLGPFFVVEAIERNNA